jgi:hypothetical protein
MDAKTFLSFETCKLIFFINFYKIVKIWLIVHLLQKKNISIKFKMAEKFTMADFLHKNSRFFGSAD